MKKNYFTRLTIYLLFFVSFISEASIPFDFIGREAQSFTTTRSSSGYYPNDFYTMYYLDSGVPIPEERLNSVFIPVEEYFMNADSYITMRDLTLSFTLTTITDPSIASLGDQFYESLIIKNRNTTTFTQTTAVDGVYSLTGSIFLPEGSYTIYAKIPAGLGYTTTLTTNFIPAGPLDPVFEPPVDPASDSQVSPVPELSETRMMFIGMLCLGGVALKRRFNPKYWRQEQNAFA